MYEMSLIELESELAAELPTRSADEPAQDALRFPPQQRWHACQ